MRFCFFIALAGCQAFNDQCTALVEEPEAIVVKLEGEVFLDRPNARLDNNAIGQAAADAFADAMGADIGVLNSGSLRSEGLCGVTRNVVSGPITDQVLHEILQFENLINAVDLTPSEVRTMFEHSVEQLFPTGTAIVSPSGQFLQISKQVRMTVDCSRSPGNRVTSVTVDGKLVDTTSTTTFYRVALTSFLLGNGDGYLFPAPARNPAQAQKLGGIDSNIASDYLKRTYVGTTLAKEQRVTFVNCASPPRPP